MRGKLLRNVGLAVACSSTLAFLPLGSTSTLHLPESPSSVAGAFSYLEYMPANLQRVHEEFERGEFDPSLRLLQSQVDSLARAGMQSTAPYLDRMDLLALGLLQSDRGTAEEIRLGAEHTLELRRELLPPGDARLALTHYTLGGAVALAGRPLEGLAHVMRSLEIRRTQIGPSSAATGVSWMGLGNVFYHQGMKAAALRAYEQSISILADEAGHGSIYSLAPLQNAAQTSRELGLYEQSLHLFERLQEGQVRFGIASGLREAQVGQFVVSTRLAMGKLEELEGAEGLLFAHLEEFEGRDRIHIAFSHSIYSSVCLLQDDLSKARQHAVAATRTVRELELGPWKGLAFSDALAATELALGNIHNAKTVLESVSFREGDQVPPSILVWDSYLRSVLARSIGDGESSIDWALAASRTTRRAAESAAVLLRDYEAYVESDRRMAPLSAALSALLQDPSALDHRVQEVWAAVADSRALTTRVLRARKRSLKQHADPVVGAMLEAVAAIRVEMGRVAMSDVPGMDRASYLDALRAELQELERLALVRGVGLESGTEARDASFVERLDFRRVLQSVPTNFALVSFVRFDRTLPRGGGRTEDVRRRIWRGNEVGPFVDPELVVPSLAAFVRPAHSDRVEILDLGPARRIEMAMSRWRSGVGDGREEAGASEETHGRTRFQAASSTLRGLLWDPVAPYLEDAATVLLIPDGQTNFLNFDALKAEDGRFLAETTVPIHYLSSEAALLELAEEPASQEQRSILVIASPSFGPDLDSLPPVSGRRHRRGVVSLGDPEDPDRAEVFQHLPAARREGEAITRLWRDKTGDEDAALLLTGRDARESTVLEEASRHSILHFATHAFVRTNASGGVASLLEAPSSSGIALAGASVATGPPSDDGLLLAEEISRLDLHRTEWVVLSACETGLGDVRIGEGVLGLRDALEQAGARTLILSLWKVMDSETQKWMLALYEARLKGLSTPESVRAANLAMLAARRAAGLDDHPRFWGAFVATGDWR